MIIFCPEKEMALELLNLLPITFPLEEAVSGWMQYQDLTCYGVADEDDIPTIVNVVSRTDPAVDNETVIEFSEWKFNRLNAKLKGVCERMCISDILEFCRVHNISITNSRPQMERAIVHKMIALASDRNISERCQGRIMD